MNLSTGWTELNGALKDLRTSWDETSPVWTDAVRRGFEEEFLTPLDAQTIATLRAMDRLAQVLLKAQQDCA